MAVLLQPPAGPPPPRLDPTRLPRASTTHRVVDLDSRRLAHGLVHAFVAPLDAALEALCGQRLRLDLDATARDSRVRWSVRRSELEPLREPCAYHAITAPDPDGARTLWRFSATLVDALLGALGSPTDGLAARALLDSELALLDTLVLEALRPAPRPPAPRPPLRGGPPGGGREGLGPGEPSSDGPAALLVSSCGGLGAAPLRVLRGRDALVHVELGLRALTDDGRTLRAPLEAVLPLSFAERAALDREASAPDFAELARCVAPLVGWTLTLGRVRLSGARLAALASGDVCLPWPASERLDAQTLTAWLRPSGADEARAVAVEVALAGTATHSGLRLRRSPHGRVPEEDGQEESMMSHPEEGRSALAQALAEARLELRLELGRLALSAEQLARLHAGDVVDPGLEAGDGVALWVGQRRIGSGELVELEGHIGVRITRLEPTASGDSDDRDDDGR